MVGIVGGGVSGLFLLHALRAAGRDALLLEREPQVGGVVRTLQLPGGPADLGPMRVRLTPGIASLLEELGLGEEVVEAPPRLPFHMVRDGRLHPVPRSPREAAATPLISLRGKLRALLDLISTAPGEDETVEEALSRKLGPEVYHFLAGPLLGGLYASDPGQMYARHTLIPALENLGVRRSLLLGLLRARHLGSTPVISFKEGMEALPQALARAHRDRIRTEVTVTGVIRAARDGFVLETDKEAVRVQRVVLAVPAQQAAHLLAGLAPEAASRLRALRYNPLAVVSMEGVLPIPGSGFKVALDEPLATRGVTSRAGLFGDHPVLAAFLGGMGRETLLAQPDGRLARMASEEFRKITGNPARPLVVHRTRVPAWDRTWASLDRLRLPAGLHLCAAYHHRPGLVGRLTEARKVARQLINGEG